MFAVPSDAASNPDFSGIVLLKQCEFGSFFFFFLSQMEPTNRYFPFYIRKCFNSACLVIGYASAWAVNERNSSATRTP